MNTTQLMIAVAVIVAVLALGAWLLSRQRRSADLRRRFGPEYDRTVRQMGDASRAESQLEARSARVSALEIRSLSTDERETFGERRRKAQAQFVDDPLAAVSAADRLVAEVMQARGYPMSDFERRAEDVSVDHPEVVGEYRSAHAIAQRQGDGQASTEDLRRAMVHYRALFAELLETPTPDQGSPGETAAEPASTGGSRRA